MTTSSRYTTSAATPMMTTRASELKSSSATFDLNLAVFHTKMTTSIMPKARKTYTTSEFEVFALFCFFVLN